MIHSMTGFGASSFRAGEAAFAIEIRSVNHRHLDARVRVPRQMSALEPELRARVQARFSRGKVDCTVASPEGSAPAASLEIDRSAARAYIDAARELASEKGVTGALEVSALLALPGVARLSEPLLTLESVRAECSEALDAALDALTQMRRAEGAAIERDLHARLERIIEIAAGLEELAATVQEAVRERLRQRVRQLESETGLLDQARLHQEVTIAADRLDVTEEIVRLRSHVDQFREAIASGGEGNPVGRRLEFLLQELSREANTIGSKGADAAIAHLVVDLKTELERMREQVQNVE